MLLKTKVLQKEEHYIKRSNWLRAAVLGANDGILSTASVIIGVAAASDTRHAIALAGIAALTAGALSMAAGEYVSVSSQADTEHADLIREEQELKDDPEGELQELADIYIERGLTKELALEVAQQLHKHNALEAHARDELGINELNKANPLEAAFASAGAFILGGILPVIVALFGSVKNMEYLQYGFTVIFLAILGGIAAKTGGTNIFKAILRITFWGTIAMVITALIGYAFDISNI